MIRRFWLATIVLFATLGLSACGYNDFQRLDEQSKSAWSEVLNQYQRRADLVPNIVATVKGEAQFEQDTLTAVTEALPEASEVASGSGGPRRVALVGKPNVGKSSLLNRLSGDERSVDRAPAGHLREVDAVAAHRAGQGRVSGRVRGETLPFRD